jgi:hypothetical protein
LNGSPDDPREEERNKLRLALAKFALQLDAFEARLKIQGGQRQTPKSVFGAIGPDPSKDGSDFCCSFELNPITHVDVAASERATRLRLANAIEADRRPIVRRSGTR